MLLGSQRTEEASSWPYSTGQADRKGGTNVHTISIRSAKSSDEITEGGNYLR